MTTTTTTDSRRRGFRAWRKMTWALIGWSALILTWAIAGGASNDARGYCEAHPSQYLSQHACEQARNVGTGIGVAAILFVGFLGFVVLSLVWFMTRPKAVA